jgi:UDP-N-acetylmuramyl tripeptide synthase
MAAAAGRLADLAVVTSDNPRTEDAMAIIREILPGFGPDATGRTEVEPDRRKAIELAITRAEPGDCVLIAGKGHEDYQLVGREVLHFDDVEVARACLGGIGVKERVA